jgi:hypothetical protein
MALDTIQRGSTSGNGAEVDADNQALVKTNTDPAKAGAARMFSENDAGDVTGAPDCTSPETDNDYRLRVAAATTLDNETFNYTAQNTGKHRYANTTMTVTWGTGGALTNATSITTTTTGVEFGSYAEFPMIGVSMLYCSFAASFSSAPVANTIIDIGLFRRSGANPYTPSDGVYLELSSSGLQLFISHNGTTASSAVLAALPGGTPYALNRVYQFIIAISERSAKLWVDNVLYATIDAPVGQGQMFMSGTLPFSMRHAITGGAAGGVLQCTLRDYDVSIEGLNLADGLGVTGNRIFGSYQGLSGGTMGSLASYANSANPTAAVPTNTTSAVLTALGGQGWETDTLAVTTDGVICSYQVPAGTVNTQAKRLRIHGVTIDSYIQTALTGGGYVAQYALAFGHTAVSLATAEAATTKAPRRVCLGVQAVASGAVINTVLSRVSQTFQCPVFVNAGEFVAVVKKKVGTAPSAGVVAHCITFDYSWE